MAKLVIIFDSARIDNGESFEVVAIRYECLSLLACVLVFYLHEANEANRLSACSCLPVTYL